MSEASSAGIALRDAELSERRPCWRCLFDGGRYYLVFLVFAVGSLLFLVSVLVLTALRSRARRGDVARRAIHLGARLFFKIVTVLGMVQVRKAASAAALASRPAIVVANHPSMLDALLLLSAIPQGVCIMKRSLLRVPIVASFAKMAGYIWQQTPQQVLSEAAGRLAEGTSIVVFPEGTRSVSGELGELKRGSSRLAVETGAPLAVFGIRMKPTVLGRGQPWWVPPQFPVQYELRQLATLEARPEGAPTGGSVDPLDARKHVFWLTKQLEVTLRNSV